MSYVRAIEGDTNSTVLDRAFHRQVQPPSQARELRTAGIPAAPVPSINRPQLFSFPRPANPTAITDLRGQQMVQVAVAPAVRHQGEIISRQRRAAIANQRAANQRFVEQQKRKKKREGMSGLGQNPAVAVLQREAAFLTSRGLTKPAARLAATVTRVKSRGMSGLGQTVSTLTFPLPTSIPGIVGQQITADVQAPILGVKLAQTGVLTGEEARLYSMLTPEQQKLYAQAGLSLAQPSTPGITDKISSWLSAKSIGGIPNGALAAGAGLFVLILSSKKGRR